MSHSTTAVDAARSLPLEAPLARPPAADHRAPRAAAKKLGANLLYASGVLQRVLRRRLRGRAVVLTYHRVLTPELARLSWSHPGMVSSAETFDAHLAALSQLFRIVSLQEFCAQIARREPFPEPSCLITFDDGWLDTYEIAWPILQRHRLPATVFMPVDAVATEAPFWQERLGQQLWAAWLRCREDRSVKAACLALLPAELHPLFSAPDGATVRAAIHRACEVVKARRGTAAPAALIEAIAAIVGPAAPAPADRLMSWAQAREMAAGGIEFGGHGATHAILTELGASELRQEVQSSMQTLVRELGSRPLGFAYPNGDWNPDVAATVAASGFQVAFTTKRGAVSTEDEPHGLARVNIAEAATFSAPMLLARMAQVV